MERARYLIGIDCGVNTGFSVYDRQKKELIQVSTMDFWQTIDRMEQMIVEYGLSNLEVYIEDVEQLRPTFQKRKVASVSVLNKVSQNVGSVKRDCQLLKSWMNRKGLRYTPLVPGRQSITKVEVEKWKMITRWKGSSSSHSRDAAMLVFGR